MSYIYMVKSRLVTVLSLGGEYPKTNQTNQQTNNKKRGQENDLQYLWKKKNMLF